MESDGEGSMTLAMKRLKNIGWLALVFMVAILLYPLSLNVASLHSDLVEMDRKILDTKREISFLQAEVRTRASVAQLEEWNDLLYGYEPPSAAQFIDGERGLANLGGAAPVVKPVMVAVNTIDGTAPAGEVGAVGAAASNAGLDGSKTASAEAVSRKAEKPVSVAMAEPKKPEAAANRAPAKPQSRTERLAKMDEQLLSDTLMRDIEKAAAKERKR
jgi:hypothetical protein